MYRVLSPAREHPATASSQGAAGGADLRRSWLSAPMRTDNR